MEYIDILNIVTKVRHEVLTRVKHEMKKNKRLIELSSDKNAEIMRIISSLDYESTDVGCRYINSNYDMTLVTIETIANAYYKSRSMRRFAEDVQIDYIKEDAERFLLLFQQEIVLRHILDKMNSEKASASNNNTKNENNGDEKNIPSDKLLAFILFAKKKEFLTLFQTIIDNRITNGLNRAAITYIIYGSKLFNRSKHHEWRPFYEQFCKDIGWETTSYKPNRLNNAVKDLKNNHHWVDAIK